MRLAEPGWLLLLVLVFVPWLCERARPRITWPTLGGFEGGSSGRGGWPRYLPAFLRGLAIACLAVALARPQTIGGRSVIAGQGVAIVVAIDNSSSMNLVDFPSEGGMTSRLDAARKTFARFIEGRHDDLIGLVVFANYPDLACPPTLNHSFLLETMRALRSARRGDDGTNLGDAIAWALDALRSAAPRKKVLILLTDGRNEPAVPHPLDPKAAAVLARDLGVTLHTIAVGRAGGIAREAEPLTGLDLVSQIDAPDLILLEHLAKLGGGRPFVAADVRTLGQVFQTINTMEKSPVRSKVRTRYRERYAPFVGLALAVLVLDRLLSAGPCRRLP